MKTSIDITSAVKEVNAVFEDLGMYGEYYAIHITFENGRKWSLRMEEHQFKALDNSWNPTPPPNGGIGHID